jgi:hypothetical protein
MGTSFKHILAIFCALLFPVACFPQIGSAQPLAASPTFEAFLSSRFRQSRPDWNPESLCPVSTNAVAARIFREYGAIFAAADSVTLPGTCVYSGEAAVIAFQKGLKTKTVETGGIQINLQQSATDALQRAITQAGEIQLTISPLDGAIAGSRSYGDTLRLWNGRFFRALDYWTKIGRLTQADREAVTGADLQKRIEMILQWEAQGIYFSTGRTRSILSSTAPPGASQHLSMLAFDVVEYGSPEIRDIMNRNGWFQTVVDDPPHFTFLGLQESELPNRGLLLVQRGSHRYWVPNIAGPIR